MRDQHQKTGKDNADDRYFPRWEAHNRVVYQQELPDAPHGEGYTKDISCAGTCLYVKEPLPLKKKLKLTISLSPRTEVDVQGTVVWQGSFPPFETGIAFHDTPSETQEIILKHAFVINRKKVTTYWFKGWGNA